MRLSIIAAIGQNRAIGFRNELPWPNLSEDKVRFRKLTEGHTVIMGRKTFKSIGKPLPNRTNIVLSRNVDLKEPGTLVLSSLEEALRLTQKEEEVFVIGGEQIYRQALPITDRLYITEVETSPEADTFFPEFDESEFEITKETRHEPNEKNKFGSTFRIYDRKKPGGEKF